MFNFKNKKEHINNLEISIAEFDKIKNEATLIDVRDHEEYEMLKKIPNTINIPYRQLISQPEKFIDNKEKQIITICNAGNRSGAAANFLSEQGYNVKSLQNGTYGYYHLHDNLKK